LAKDWIVEELLYSFDDAGDRRESAIAVSSQSGKSLIADRALVTAPEMVDTGSAIGAFYIFWLLENQRFSPQI
jgi:hypothetical protein